MRIGDFGAAKRELSGEKDDFVFCGELFVVERAMPAVLMLQLGASVSGKIDETEGFAAIWEALRVSLTVPEYRRLAATDEYDDADENRNILVPEDDTPFRKLYGLAVDNGVELEDMMKLVMGLFEAQTGRPTKSAPASSGGPPTISASSKTLLTPSVSSHLRSVDSLIRGESETIQVDTDSNVIQMGDGQLVPIEYGPPSTGQTG
jgi:hypothetical protein